MKIRPNVVGLKNIPEDWKKIEGTNYWVSSEGRFACEYMNDHIVEPSYHKPTKTYRIKIGNNTYQCNRLVWTHFKGEIPKGYNVINVNGCKSMNDVYNLALEPRKVTNSKIAKNKARKIIDIDTGRIFKNANEAAKHYYCVAQHIRAIANGGANNTLANLKYVEDEYDLCSEAL